MYLKNVAWSYPSSPNAERFGYARTGCWTVEIMLGASGLPFHLAGFETPEEAIIFGCMLEMEWHPFFYRLQNPAVRDLVLGEA